MANFSDLTRKEQVLAYLRERAGHWVDGPELATEAVGGSEGLRRLRELRLSGDYDIRERRHPDPQRDIWQYMLVLDLVAEAKRIFADDLAPPPLDFGDLDTEDSKPSYPDATTEAARREEEAQRLLDLPIPDEAESPWPADHGQTRMSSAVKKKEDGTFEYVPPQRSLGVAEQLETPPDPPQPPGSAFTSLPKQIRWGEMAVCPRCHMKTTRGRKSKPKADEGLVPEHIAQRKRKSKEQDGPALQDSEGVLLYRDPHSRKATPCIRCNGYGIVPNEGPISLTMPTGPGPSEPHEEAKTLELDL